jgi:hypothetical protein
VAWDFPVLGHSQRNAEITMRGKHMTESGKGTTADVQTALPSAVPPTTEGETIPA